MATRPSEATRRLGFDGLGRSLRGLSRHTAWIIDRRARLAGSTFSGARHSPSRGTLLHAAHRCLSLPASSVFRCPSPALRPLTTMLTIAGFGTTNHGNPRRSSFGPAAHGGSPVTLPKDRPVQYQKSPTP